MSLLIVPGARSFLPTSSPQPDMPSTSETEKRRPTSRPSSPPAKRQKRMLEEPPFVTGFIAVAGAKPKAADYAAPADAVLIRAANHYGARILACDATPSSAKRELWLQQTYKEAGKAEGHRYPD